MDEKLRAFSWRRQGLDGSLAKASPAEVLSRTGWARSVGGSSPYLALKARAGLGRAAIDEAIAKVEICELPAARGCTYVVPAADFALALQAGAGGAEVEIAQAKKHLAVTDKELDKLATAVVDLTGKQALDPKDLRDALGDKVRNLGEAGKKRGVTTTLPLVLGRLQSQGLIRRIPVGGRLDEQRYRYVGWKPGPLKKPLAPAEVAIELARRYFRWAAPATLAHFGWWSALGAKERKSAAGDLGLVPIDAGSDRLVFPDDRDALTEKPPRTVQLDFLGSIDNLFHLRRELPTTAEGTVQDLEHHGIVDRGELVGYWEYDLENGRVAFSTLKKVPSAAKAAAAMAEWIADELGDARSFSLDSPASRGPRIAKLTLSAELGRRP